MTTTAPAAACSFDECIDPPEFWAPCNGCDGCGRLCLRHAIVLDEGTYHCECGATLRATLYLIAEGDR